jgi:DNA-directed RNA polymerase
LHERRTKIDRETELETLARTKGIDRVRKEVAKANEKGQGADTPGGVAVIKRTIEPLSKAITADVEKAKSGGAGRRMIATTLLTSIDPDVAAYLTLKIAISASLRRAPLTATAVSIATAIEDELRLAYFEGKEPGLYHLIDRRMRERGAAPDHTRSVFIFTANKFKMEMPSFTRVQKTHLGVKLIELLTASTGLVSTQHVHLGRNHTSVRLLPAEHVAEWINDRNVKAELLRPYYMPTVAKPRPWTGLWGGGYHTEQLLPKCIVKNAAKTHLELLEKADLSNVLRSLNAIQDTAWQINRRVLDVMSGVWEAGTDIAMPNREDLPLPPKPGNLPPRGTTGTPDQEEAKQAWKIAAKRVYEKNSQTRGKRLAIAMMLAAADTLKDDAAIYFPHQLDFRGRAYAMPVGLNPQGPDHARALLTFSEGKAINTPRAAGWLAIHGANLWGYDKVDLEGRVAWAEENADRVLAVAADPLANLWWTEADGGKKAWSFLAWCFEYAGFLKEGFGYVSSLPISVDGSCNGLQHFSAMLRDPIGGEATNLVPSETPSDIYQRVADKAVERLSADGEQNWQASTWAQFGIDRKLTKRPVMVLPYGGTFRSCLQYVRDAFNDRVTGGEPNPFGDEAKTATAYLAQTVWHSISDVVVAARAAMEWLHDVARVAAKQAQPDAPPG